MVVPSGGCPFNKVMLRTATLYLGARVRERGRLIPVGITWSFLITADVVVILCGATAALQRPVTDLPVALAAFAITVSPILSFVLFNTKFSPVLLGAAWSVATALLLFATSTPIRADLAPALLALMVGTVGSLTSPIDGFVALVAAATLLLTASALHRLDGAPLYFGLLALGWVIGYLVHAQCAQVAKRLRAQAALDERAATEERRRDAHEMQELITVSLAGTLQRLTGARRALQQDQDVDDALGALERAKRESRRAMDELWCTAELSDPGNGQTAPEPGIDDIGVLVEDFARGGLAVTLSIVGSSQDVTPEVGQALYGITQEMLANIARHAPDSKSTVALAISPGSAQLAINTDPADLVDATHTCAGHGMRRMRQQVGSLGGAIEYGPSHDGWAVCVEIPLQECDSDWCPWWCAL